MKSRFVMLCCLAGFVVPASASIAAIEPKAAREIYEKVAPSLVVVQYSYDGELARRELASCGIVVSSDGLIIASESFTPPQLSDAQMKDFKIIVPGDEETELAADFLGRDDRSGLTFFKAREKHDWKPLKFEDVKVEVGDDLLAVGLLPKEAGYKARLTASTVSAALRGPVRQILVTGDGLAGVGAPVLNAQGQAIGFTPAYERQSPLLNGHEDWLPMLETAPRLFIPASDFMISLHEPPTVNKPIVLPNLGVGGLSGLTKDVAEYYGLKNQPAVQVGDVLPNLPADKAGLKAGDVIVKVNGQPLERGDQPEETPLIMTRNILRMHVGETVKFSVMRERDKPLTEIDLTLGERPPGANQALRFWAEDLGFSVRELVFDDTYLRKLPADTKGVLVALIKPNSSAQTGKLANGDVIKKINQTDVQSLEQFKAQYQEFRKSHPGDAVVLEVLRGVNTAIVRIEPPQ